MTSPEIKVRQMLSLDRELFFTICRLWHSVPLPSNLSYMDWIPPQ